MFYIHPLGHGLYLREDIDGERRERPVFTHNAAPTWHLSGCHSDQDCFEAKAPSDRFWTCVRLIYEDSMHDDEEEYRKKIQQAKDLSEELEYHETDTLDKLFSQLHQLDCPAREIEVFDRIFEEVEGDGAIASSIKSFRSKINEIEKVLNKDSDSLTEGENQ